MALADLVGLPGSCEYFTMASASAAVGSATGKEGEGRLRTNTAGGQLPELRVDGVVALGGRHGVRGGKRG